MRAAVISGNVVDNVIITDDPEQSAIDLKMPVIGLSDDSLVGIGWYYNLETGEFTPPHNSEN